FIHAVNARKHFSSPDELELSKWDLYISISIGGVITAAVLITAGTVMRGMQIEGISEMSEALRPVLGGFAPVFLSIGMISAGLSSAIAVPLGASYVLAGLFGWHYDRSDKRYLIVNLAVLVFGILISATGFRPVYIILAAQVLNGIILPLAVIFLVCITSMPRFMGRHANGTPVMIAGGAIALITVTLGARSLFEILFAG
ncbi:MAG: divalent metal cation transporter, partial [Rhodospirillaceae bacterium]